MHAAAIAAVDLIRGIARTVGMNVLEVAGATGYLDANYAAKSAAAAEALQAYELQDQGLDTVEANQKLGLPVDRRDYGVGAQIIRDLGLRQLRILTNNPKKVNRLEVYGMKITEQLPIEIPPTEHNRDYLRAKRDKMGHKLKDV